MAEQISNEQREAERAKPTVEVGTTGLLEFHGNIEEAYLPELRYPAAYAKFNEMRRRDPTIRSLLNAVNLLARTAIWTVEPAGEEEADQKAAEFLNQNLDDMSIVKEDAVEDLMSAIPFGWAWSEIVYKRRGGPTRDPASKYDDQLIGWRKFAPRRQSSFDKWALDENGGVQGMWQTSRADLKMIRRFLPIQKSIHFVADRDMGNPEGMSILEPIYEPWHYVKNLQIINGIGFERSFVGLPKFTYGTPENPYTPSAEDMAIVASVGKRLRVDEKAYIALPGQIGFELVTTSNTNASSLLDTIKQYRIWMLMVVLADFIALGTLGSGGSYALGQDKSELFLMAVDGWLDKIAGVLNRYAVPRLFSYNAFDGITDYPIIKHSSVQKPNLPALASFLSSLALYIQPDALLEAELRRMANLPEAVDEEDGEQPESDDPETGDQENEDMGGEQGRQLARRGLSNRHLRRYERQFQMALRDYRTARQVQ